VCRAAARSQEPARVVVRSSARAPRPALVQGPGVGGLAGAADGNEGALVLGRVSEPQLQIRRTVEELGLDAILNCLTSG